MIWADQPWLCLDTETTGVDTATAEVVELAAVSMLGGEVTDRR